MEGAPSHRHECPPDAVRANSVGAGKSRCLGESDPIEAAGKSASRDPRGEGRMTAMRHWDMRSLDVAPHQPEVLQSEGEGRSIVIQLPAGEALQEHQVHERAWLVVVDGEIELVQDGGSERAGPGTLAVFEPAARDETVERLRSEGIEVDGETGESDPLLALEDALATFPADRVVIFRHPEGEEAYLEDEVIAEARERLGVPVVTAEVSR